MSSISELSTLMFFSFAPCLMSSCCANESIISSRTDSGVMALSASHWPQVSASVMLIWERMLSTMPVTSSSGISVPLTVAATPPV